MGFPCWVLNIVYGGDKDWFVLDIFIYIGLSTED